METGKLKNFAQYARRILLETIGNKLKIVLDPQSAAMREQTQAVKDLEKAINRTSEDQVIEKVAYVWFNRFCALRFMDINRYSKIRLVSPVKNFSQPEILMEAKQGYIDDSLDIDRSKVSGLLNGTIPSLEPQQEAYQMLLVAACNAYYKVMPFLFQKIADYTELLMPDDLLSDNSILKATREALSEETCKDVEVIGWLYQFYIAEKKDEVFADLKKNKKVLPENIPAATQLFTPNWIVRYLVENSLGRLWMLNRPDSRLIDKMDYYIKPEQQETDFLKITSPEEIKICDPACGSGHMLVYAFEILYAIYEEEGYEAPKIPDLILKNNLFGIEIDERAGELAAFALFMKAREKYRRFFKKAVQPNICVLENISFKKGEVKEYMEAVNPDLFTSDLQTLLYQFEEADNFGSLIRPALTNISDILHLLDERKVSENIFLQDIHKIVLKVLKQADYLSPKYHVVIANPPYMGGKGMNQRLGKWLKDNYPDVKSDLFSAFIVRNTELALLKGQLGFMSPFVWMFISSYEKLRNFLIDQKTLTSLVQLEYSGFDGATVPICTFTVENFYNPDFKGGYVRLSDFRGSENQSPKILEAIKNPNCGWFFSASASDFKKIPGCPIAYWASVPLGDIFQKNKSVEDYFAVNPGIRTGKDKLFLRFWFEVANNNTQFGLTDCSQMEWEKRWFPLHKGGSFRKWYGNAEHVIDLYQDGVEISTKSPDFRLRENKWYFQPFVSWSRISSANIAFRFFDRGILFSDAGPGIFAKEQCIKVMGLLNSKLGNHFLKVINPTLNYQKQDIEKIPYIRLEKDVDVSRTVAIARTDWNFFETSWDFTILLLLHPDFCHSKLEFTYTLLRERWWEMILEMKQLEEENNQIFIETYGLNKELTSDVPLNEITLTCNPYYRYGNNKTDEEREILLLADTMKEFISYSVGCMFGRYSLDKPGLILANQGETIKDYLTIIPEPTFKPDNDNVIPIMDVDWFTDDIAERFKNFLKITFGKENFAENLAFIEDAIGKDIRKYFLKEFYTYHVKMYKKRPVYWMFSSPKGSFNALIYMHRYQPDTVSIVLNDYLREFKTKLSARKDNLENISISASGSQKEKTKALKEIEKIKKVLEELNDYEKDILYPLATKQIEIDLDDGVKVNYPKFGKALKKVAGLS